MKLKAILSLALVALLSLTPAVAEAKFRAGGFSARSSSFRVGGVSRPSTPKVTPRPSVPSVAPKPAPKVAPKPAPVVTKPVPPKTSTYTTYRTTPRPVVVQQPSFFSNFMSTLTALWIFDWLFDDDAEEKKAPNAQ